MVWDRLRVAAAKVPGLRRLAREHNYVVTALEPGANVGGKRVFHGRLMPMDESSIYTTDHPIALLNGADDPCNITIVTDEDKDRVRKLIANHPCFEYPIDPANGEDTPIERGDTFTVYLPLSITRNRQIGLQGTITVSTRLRKGSPAALAPPASSCLSLINAFEEEDAIILEEVYGSNILEGNYIGAHKPGEIPFAVTNGSLANDGLIAQTTYQQSGVPSNYQPYLLKDVIEDFVDFQKAFHKKYPSWMLGGSGNRTYAAQVAVKQTWARKGQSDMAAPPGTSNHGWGLAVDLRVFKFVADAKIDLGAKIESAQLAFDADEYEWLKTNAPAYNWENPDWAQSGGTGPNEAWHFEYKNKNNLIRDIK
jgi:hypothetical protein